jgi:hypothetical protein
VLAPPREPGAVALLRHGDERDEEFLALDVAPVGICDSRTSSSELGTEDIRVDDDCRSPGGHASAMALRKASSSSSVRPSMIISS